MKKESTRSVTKPSGNGQGTDEKEFIQSVVFLIGGEKTPDENMKRYLARAFLHAGVSWSCGRAAFYEGRMSDETRNKFEKAAQRARQTHDLVAYAKHKLVVWRKRPELYGPYIAATCRFLDEINSCSGTWSGSDAVAGDRDVSGRNDDGSGETAGCALAPA